MPSHYSGVPRQDDLAQVSQNLDLTQAQGAQTLGGLSFAEPELVEYGGYGGGRAARGLLTGTVSGALAGAKFGPYGAIAGGVIGAAGSLFKMQAESDAEVAAVEEQNRQINAAYMKDLGNTANSVFAAVDKQRKMLRKTEKGFRQVTEAKAFSIAEETQKAVNAYSAFTTGTTAVTRQAKRSFKHAKKSGKLRQASWGASVQAMNAKMEETELKIDRQELLGHLLWFKSLVGTGEYGQYHIDQLTGTRAAGMFADWNIKTEGTKYGEGEAITYGYYGQDLTKAQKGSDVYFYGTATAESVHYQNLDDEMDANIAIYSRSS